MIKIRYADLPPGRHAHVCAAGRRPVIYLVPGLSPAQRRDALGRLIRTSRQGYGPRLRAPGVRFAVARDAAKTTARNALAAVRCHPAGSTALAAFIAAGVICYAIFVTVTVRFTPHPGGPPVAGPPVAGPPVAGPSGPPGPGSRSPGSGAAGPAGTQLPVTGRRAASAAGTGARIGPRTGPAPSGPAASPGPLPTGTWSAPGGVLPPGSAGPPPPASSPPSATPSPAPSAAPPPATPAPPAILPG